MAAPGIQLTGISNITMTPAEYDNLQVIFAHYLDGQTTPFYIGMCKFHRLYDFTDAYRNSLWRKMVTPDTQLRVEIVGLAETVHQGGEILKELYAGWRPHANMQGHMLTGKVVVTCLEGENVGQMYSTASAAAKMNGISNGAMSNHLNGYKGYEKIRGMRFKKGI